jgi:serine/threonine protein kinase
MSDCSSLLPTPRELPPGARVGTYRIAHSLGAGGMSRVYAAEHLITGRQVAIKLAACDSAVGPVAQLHQFLEEARATRRIGHPGVIEVYAIGQRRNGLPFIVMERLEGETLEQRVQRGRLTPLERFYLVSAMCTVLDATHAAGVVHCDLKPENIFITQPGTAGAPVKLLDFGAARLLRGDRGPERGRSLGTPAFMAPEQCLEGPVGHRADIYALGVILYWLFSGKLPFRATTLAAVLDQQISEPPVPPSRHRRVPVAVDSLILACLEKDPGRRPGDGATVAGRLAAALAPAAPRPQSAGAPCDYAWRHLEFPANMRPGDEGSIGPAHGTARIVAVRPAVALRQ